MVTTSILVGTAATFFSLGGIFCLYIHSVAQSMRRSPSAELICGTSVANSVCCERDIDNEEVKCSRDGICGINLKTKKNKETDEDEPIVIIPLEKDFKTDEKTSNVSDNKAELMKTDEHGPISGLNNENQESIEGKTLKLQKEGNIQHRSLAPEEIETEIVNEDLAKDQDLNIQEKNNSLGKMEKSSQEQVQIGDREDKEMQQNQIALMTKKDKKRKKQEEKEAKKLQQKEMKKKEKEDKKKMQLEKKKMNEEKKNIKKEQKSLEKHKQKHPKKKKSEQKSEASVKEEIEEHLSNKDIIPVHTNYQTVRAILEGGRIKPERREELTFYWQKVVKWHQEKQCFLQYCCN